MRFFELLRRKTPEKPTVTAQIAEHDVEIKVLSPIPIGTDVIPDTPYELILEHFNNIIRTVVKNLEVQKDRSISCQYRTRLGISNFTLILTNTNSNYALTCTMDKATFPDPVEPIGSYLQRVNPSSLAEPVIHFFEFELLFDGNNDANIESMTYEVSLIVADIIFSIFGSDILPEGS